MKATKETLKNLQLLREEITEHCYRYYVLNDPSITDAEYDKLYQQLVEIEQQHPKLITPDSPTQRVSSDLESDYVVKYVNSILRVNRK